MATAMALLHFEDRFAVVSRASVDSNPLEAVHRWVFSMGISLAGLLSLGATLSAAATMREAPGLLAMGFLCFALVFCSLVQVAFWRFHNPTQFLCCGKRSPFQLLGSREADPCRGEEAAREVYAMLLSSFLYFAVRSGRGLDRRGKYTLTPRACGCQAQEPSRFTLSQ
uniref:Tetraspanin 32 n=1 Tax=Marmota marmota marmota TaxID=9994 RepID=A0A8C5YUB2_MARMA